MAIDWLLELTIGHRHKDTKMARPLWRAIPTLQHS